MCYLSIARLPNCHILQSFSFPSILVCFPPQPNTTWTGKGFYVHVHVTVHSQASQGRNLRQQKSGGRNGSRGNGGMLFPGLLSMTWSSCFLIQPKLFCQGCYSLRAGPSHINQENCPTGFP